MNVILLAWSHATKTTIKKCFIKAGLGHQKSDNNEDVTDDDAGMLVF